jgi:hypothetical protein
MIMVRSPCAQAAPMVITRWDTRIFRIIFRIAVHWAAAVSFCMRRVGGLCSVVLQVV